MARVREGTGMRRLWPEIEPDETGLLDVGDGHRIYWEVCGARGGKPAVVLHGPLESLGWEEFVVILPPGDPLRRSEEPVALAALAEREWVLFEREHALAGLI